MRYERNKKTISGKLHDELVMMDMDQGKYFSLNQTATVIWELLERPLTIEELCEKLTEEFEIDREQCEADTKQYLGEMMKLGLIRIIEG